MFEALLNSPYANCGQGKMCGRARESAAPRLSQPIIYVNKPTLNE